MKQREIKFRIWNGKNCFCTEDFVRSNLINILEINPGYVQQFTGLLDKDGKEIWEGDIVEVNDEFEITKHSAPMLIQK